MQKKQSTYTLLSYFCIRTHLSLFFHFDQNYDSKWLIQILGWKCLMRQLLNLFFVGYPRYRWMCLNYYAVNVRLSPLGFSSIFLFLKMFTEEAKEGNAQKWKTFNCYCLVLCERGHCHEMSILKTAFTTTHQTFFFPSIFLQQSILRSSKMTDLRWLTRVLWELLDNWVWLTILLHLTLKLMTLNLLCSI